MHTTSNIPVKQSGIRSATIQCENLGGINLGQGVCDLPTHDSLKLAAINAIINDKNTYASLEGVYTLREKIEFKLRNYNQIKLNSIDEVMVSHGSTGAFICAVKALTKPEDEAILIEPFYGYHKQILDMHQVITKTIKINLEDLSIDLEQLTNLITNKTKILILCNPANPSGKVFTRNELKQLGDIAKKHKICVITDEIYEYITYPGHKHISLASIDDFKEYTVTISGLSKTYNITGWRIGYACGPKEIIKKMSLIHDLLYICPPTPLQYASIKAFDFEDDYYNQLRESYLLKRDQTVQYLKDMGFNPTIPQGAYYIVVDYLHHPLLSKFDDIELADFFLKKAKVAVVPGRFFYDDYRDGNGQFRICYALNEEKVIRGLEQLKRICSS